MITIFTDGSSRGNPGPGGWGAIIATEDKVIELGGRETLTTNNRMELMAAIRSLEEIKKQNLDDKIVIFSDSSYVVKGITEWIQNWMRKGWKTANKKPVENQDLWKDLYNAAENLDIDWRLVPGHAGVQANERCDEIATSYADNLPLKLYKDKRLTYRVSLNEKAL